MNLDAEMLFRRDLVNWKESLSYWSWWWHHHGNADDHDDEDDGDDDDDEEDDDADLSCGSYVVLSPKCDGHHKAWVACLL